MTRFGWIVGFVIAGLGHAAAACGPATYEGADFVLCEFDLRQDDVRLYWRGADNSAFANFTALGESLKRQRRALRFAMNAGMYQEDLTPAGLYVEDGKLLHPADVRDGTSNFRLKPNGIFWIGEHSAGVMETSRYLANPPPAKYATQSGPMLVIDGRIHPKILPSGVSAKRRNGVCVRDGARLALAISEAPVTFHAFARLFRDRLACADALFLDGAISSLYAPELDRDDELAPLGPMIAVTAPAR